MGRAPDQCCFFGFSSSLPTPFPAPFADWLKPTNAAGTSSFRPMLHSQVKLLVCLLQMFFCRSGSFVVLVPLDSYWLACSSFSWRFCCLPSHSQSVSLSQFNVAFFLHSSSGTLPVGSAELQSSRYCYEARNIDRSSYELGFMQFFRDPDVVSAKTTCRSIIIGRNT